MAVMTTNINTDSSGNTVLLEIQEVVVRVPNSKVTRALLFFDPGATLSLCTHSWASRFCLNSRPITIFLKVVNSACEQINTREYQFWLLDNDGKEHEVWAVGLGNITEEAEHSSLETLYDQFPEIDRQLIKRPSGSVDVLLEMDYQGFHHIVRMS